MGEKKKTSGSVGKKKDIRCDYFQFQFFFFKKVSIGLTTGIFVKKKPTGIR